MKRVFVLMVATLLVTGMSASAQGTNCVGSQYGYGTKKQMRMREGAIPNLTEEQRAKISDIRLKRNNEVVLLRAELKVKQAELNKLLLDAKSKESVINKAVDEIAGIKANIQKKKIASRLEIAAQLSDEQKAAYSSDTGGQLGCAGFCGCGNRAQGMGKSGGHRNRMRGGF